VFDLLFIWYSFVFNSITREISLYSCVREYTQCFFYLGSLYFSPSLKATQRIVNGLACL
jgi:hypothetical protein